MTVGEGMSHTLADLRSVCDNSGANLAMVWPQVSRRLEHASANPNLYSRVDKDELLALLNRCVNLLLSHPSVNHQHAHLTLVLPPPAL